MGSLHLLLLLMAIALLLAVYAVARRHRVARIQGTPVLIGEAMKRRGITPADVGAAGLEAELVAAKARCASCTSDAACRVLLGEPWRFDLPATCPNRNFFERVERHKSAASADRSFAAWR